MKLEGKCAIVTGGSVGIGKAIVSEFLKEGARVVLCARTESKIQAAVKELSALGEVYGVPADVGSAADVAKLFEFTAKKLGRLDILVNNAAVIHQAAVSYTHLTLPTKRIV